MTGPGPTVVPAVGPPPDDRGPIARYLAARRWAGARGGALRVLEGGATAVPFEEPPVDMHVVPVAVGGGAPYELLLPLVTRPAGHPDAPPRAECVAALGGAVVFDATLDAEFRLRLLDAVRAGRPFVSPAVVARALDGAIVPPARSSRVGTAEQSNTSIVYDDAGVILKLFRRVAVGENPDVEVGHFLARRDFPHVPRLYGTLTLRRAGGEAVIGMAQALVPGAEDAWAHAVRAARAAVQGSAPADAYAADASRLGTVTRALHDALASDPDDPDFAPERADARYVGRWAAAAGRALDAAAEAAASSEAPGAAMLRASRGDVAARIAGAAQSLGDDAGWAVRHHGDYHLGQVLRTADGALYVIDFEGEPARPLAERRAKHSPLRDVAGMLRSFAYAAAFAERGAPAVAGARAAGAAWERAARGAFLGAYFAGDRAPYLPTARAGADALLALFELEKLVYEVRYELQNRPDWADIPLGALARALAAPAGAPAGDTLGGAA